MDTLRILEKHCKALANAKRLLILRILKKAQQAPVGTVARAIGLSFRSTSKHLAILERAGILERTKQGTLVFHRLSRKQPDHVRTLLKFL